jgi:phosphatidylinositol kinase/protein kinase (PI-3  family)
VPKSACACPRLQISKSNDDIRQEVFAMQLITKFQDIFRASQLPLWLRPYRIVSTGRSCGLLETITDAQSLDALKKHKDYAGLREHFERTYGHGDAHSPTFKAAQRNFLHSLVAYSLVCYLLQIKDRHNGNIMLDTQGHLVHIDFGFMLGIAPGGAWSFETAPFKLTKEMVEVLGGVASPLFGEFVRLFALGMLAAQRHADQITTLVEIMMYNSTFPCFRGRDASRDLHKLRTRFLPGHSAEQTVKAVVKMVRLSFRNKWTKRYDQFQKLTNGIVP